MTAWKQTSACNRECGGGNRTETRAVVSPAYFGGTPCGTRVRRLGCNNMACPTFEYKATRWYKCNKACGGGIRRRQIACVRSDGKTIAAAGCKHLASKPSATMPCNTEACATYMWDATPWSKCSKSCTGEDGISGKVRRTVKCINGATKQTVADNSLCLQTVVDTEKICNTRKCTTYAFSIGAWGACTKTCGGGALLRTVRCMGSDGQQASGASKCAMEAPQTSGKCNTATCDLCAMVRTSGETCSGHGTCAAATGACTCTGGFSGMQCDAPPGCSGVLDKNSKCCLGTLNPDGTCCKSSSSKGAAITADGACCRSGELDVCGQCDGTATAVDAIGTCCSPPGVVGEDSLCCASGLFDTCGVCEGDDSSCNVAGGMTLAAPAGETADSVLADGTKLQTFKDNFKGNLVTALGVPANAVTITGVVKQARRRLMDGGTSARRLAASGSLDASFQLEQAAVSAAGGAAKSAVDVTSSLSDAAASVSGAFAGATVAPSEPAAVCGNGACEAGERCTDSGCTGGCKGDCPYQTIACPTPWWPSGGECGGRGKCISSSGACVCFTKQGYVGAACDECVGGYVMRPSTRECVRVISAADKAADTTPAPTPMRSDVLVPATITGFTTATFTINVIDAFRTAFAAKTGANLGDVDLRNIASVRRLAELELMELGGMVGRTGSRALASGGIKFEVMVSLENPSAASDFETKVKNVGDAELLKAFAESLTAAGEIVPANLATSKTLPSTLPVTSAPTPAPPPHVAPRAVYAPSATVTTLHSYMQQTGGVNERYDATKTVEAAGAVAAVAAVMGVLSLLLFLLFVFCQTCCKRCQLCYHAHLSEKHHSRAKIIQTILFVLFCGLLCGSIKGRDSFHKAADTLAPALSRTAGLFNEMEAGALGVDAAGVQFEARFATLTACSPTKCSACPWPGDESKNGPEANWDKSARTLLVGADGSGGSAATMRPQISTFKTQGDKLVKMLKGQGAQIQKLSDTMAKDGKAYIDAFIGVTVAFGFVVALLGCVGVWCMSKKTAGHGCHFSTLFVLLAQIIGALFVVLLIVLVTLEASTSVFLAEICYQPVPETTLIDTLTQDGKYNALKKDQFDAPTLKYYFTCQGPNTLGTRLTNATDQIAGLDPELRRVQECDTLALRKTIPDATAAIASVQYALNCPRVQDLLLTFTRDAVCTHMVDGLYNLWTVQAAAGTFLLIALVVLRLVAQSFKDTPDQALPQQALPRAELEKQLDSLDHSNPTTPDTTAAAPDAAAKAVSNTVIAANAAAAEQAAAEAAAKEAAAKEAAANQVALSAAAEEDRAARCIVRFVRRLADQCAGRAAPISMLDVVKLEVDRHRAEVIARTNAVAQAAAQGGPALAAAINDLKIAARASAEHTRAEAARANAEAAERSVPAAEEEEPQDAGDGIEDEGAQQQQQQQQEDVEDELAPKPAAAPRPLPEPVLAPALTVAAAMNEEARAREVAEAAAAALQAAKAKAKAAADAIASAEAISAAERLATAERRRRSSSSSEEEQ